MTTTHPSTIYIDLDGTLCPIKKEGERYEDLPACQAVVERLRRARESGFRIVVHTARNMRTYRGDLATINARTAPLILDWLNRQQVPFDGLVVGKLWPGPGGYYVDDRTVRPDEFVQLSDSEIAALLKASA